MTIFDYIVVGSGCTGAMAAETLVRSGASVLMLDAGIGGDKYAQLIPDKDYLSIRKTEQDQYRYLIGDELEGITWGEIETGEHFTPSRKYILDLIDRYLPLESSTFSPMESLAYGGLGNAWGLGCCQFSDAELTAAGLNPTNMQRAYEVVAGRIGISGNADDGSPYTVGRLQQYDPIPEMDTNQARLFASYENSRSELNKKGFYMGRTALALITKDRGDRKKYAYRDMDFYSDHNKSAYRPWMTVDVLKTKPNFHYIGGQLVTSFAEEPDHVAVKSISITDHTEKVFTSRKVIFCSSVLSTARIVLRSFDSNNHRLPILCNPYSVTPCVQLSMMGEGVSYKKTGFSQLSLFHDPTHTNFDVSMASLYSYQSLMLFRLAKESPLNFTDTKILMRYLMPGLVIMGIHHPDTATDSKYLELTKDTASITGDKLQATYQLNNREKEKIDTVERQYIKALRSLRTFSLKRMQKNSGASIHYAGTMPFSKEDAAFRLMPDGRLGGTRNIYVADGSGFTYLPAKGLTFSLMANAHLVAENALQNE